MKVKLPANAGFHHFLRFDLRALSFEEGLRAGLAVATLVAVAYTLHARILLESGLGALLTCLCDAGGLVRRRVPALLAFGLIGASMVAGFGLLRPLGPAIIPLASLLLFLFSFIRIYGQSAQQVGTLLSVVLVLSLNRPFTALHPALLTATAFFAGALWALLLTMVIWRLHPYRPARIAVARIYQHLAAMADSLHATAGTHTTPGHESAWERHARIHRRQVRDAIEAARTEVGQRLRTLGTVTHPAAQALIRLESADQMFRILIALTDLLESDPASSPQTTPLLPPVAALLRAFAPHIVQDTDAGLAAIGARIAILAAQVRTLPQGPARRIFDALLERLRATLNISGIANAAAPPAHGFGTGTMLGPLRANLSWQSAPLRHAARVALVAAIGLAITFRWPSTYSHWLTITLVVTLQPQYALTLQRALERIGGTVCGGLFAALIGLFCHGPLALTAAILPLSVIALSLRAVNFGLYMAALTPVIVLLVELGSAGHSPMAIALMRGLYTLTGGILAVLGCMFLWPSWEPDRLASEVSTAIRAHIRYALYALGAPATDTEIDLARRTAGMSSNNLEASLGRALLEPRASARPHLQAALVIDAALRRLAGRLAALQVTGTHIPPSPALAAWRTWIEAAGAMVQAENPPPLPPLPDQPPPDPQIAETVTRVARQLTLIAGALSPSQP